ncbi:hypothetical protein POUND7_010803 [Theobroma cacao]
MPNNWIEFLPLAALAFLSSCSAAKVEYDATAIVIDGQRKIINAGAIHYPRSTEEMWPDLIQKAKDGGLYAIETYIPDFPCVFGCFQYDFSGNLNFIKFFQLIQEAGLYAILRITLDLMSVLNGIMVKGFPMWLHNTPGIQLRNDNEIYKREMEIFTTNIVDMVIRAKLFAPQGGPIILAQIENEYGNIMEGYGEAGKNCIQRCAQMAVAQNVGVPWFMCQQADAPQSMINTCNGFYCDQFTANNPKSPKMWTENWTGWFKLWGGKDPHRAAEEPAFAVARFFHQGGILNNYYMVGLIIIMVEQTSDALLEVHAFTTSYDYDAQLDEYGNLNQHKYGHLKQLHAALRVGEKALTTGTVTTKNYGKDVDLTMYANNTTGERSCFLSNVNGQNDVDVDLDQDGKYFVPAWSVGIIQNCNKEIYNSAKLSSQTSVMIRNLNYKDETEDANGDANEGDADVPETEEQAPKLNWTWAPEAMRDTLHGKGRFRATVLDQKEATLDISDYLWYMTSSNESKFRGMGKGHVWVNGYSIGRYWPSQIADANGCSDTCDYRGSYKDNRCRTNCGNPSQRWYHIPRSFLNSNGANTLILFEEIGGNTTDISFQIVTVGAICGFAYECSTLELSCQGGRTIADIQFASFGDPQGSCGSYKAGSFQATTSLAAVEKAFVGKPSCSIDVSEATFGLRNLGVTKKLAVEAVCG